jgi:hypothetical protein
MHAISLLQTWLERNGVIGHQARVVALMRVVESLLSGGKLSLTQLGRYRAGTAYVKHHIKAVDRLLGNHHLHAEREGIYRALSARVLAGIARPVIVVDWADTARDRDWLTLRASVPVDGRAITLYEEVHPLRHYNKQRTHRRFLDTLNRVLPTPCRPVIVTDAGFRGPWFIQVESYGWDWVGRIRNRVNYLNPATGRWRDIQSLYSQATTRVRHLGRVVMSKQRRYACRLYLVRAYQRGPGRPRKRKNRGTNLDLYRKQHRTPWLLATSLPHRRGAGKAVKAIYAKRMGIEEAFRDVKNLRWGFALRYARSQSAHRVEILLLIATLAACVQWVMGLVARAKRWERHFQANTERKRRALSTVFIGNELMRSSRFKPKRIEIISALRCLCGLVERDASYA